MDGDNTKVPFLSHKTTLNIDMEVQKIWVRNMGR